MAWFRMYSFCMNQRPVVCSFNEAVAFVAGSLPGSGLVSHSRPPAELTANSRTLTAASLVSNMQYQLKSRMAVATGEWR